jgi:hypothetical protein
LHDLEQQVLEYLRRIRISDRVHHWAISEIENTRHTRAEKDEAQIGELKKAVLNTERAVSSLTDLRVRELIDDAEFVAKREKLRADIGRFREKIEERRDSTDYWFEPGRSLLAFSNLAVSWFSEGTAQDRRLILASLGSNLTLSSRILNVQAMEPFNLMPKTTNCLRLYSFVDAIRELSSDHCFQKCLESIKMLVAKHGDSRALPTSPDTSSPSLTRSAKGGKSARRE